MSKELYLQTKITPILEPLLTEIYSAAPHDIPSFCLRWLKDKLISASEKSELESLRKQLSMLRSPGVMDGDSSSDDSSDYIEEVQVRRSSQRSSVSAEAYGTWNKPKEFVASEIQKSPEQLTNIISRLGCSFIFSALDTKQRTIVAKAMSLYEAAPSQEIIKQGDSGNSLFFVESGKLECFKQIEGNKVFLKHYGPNEAFGELALLYNCPRAASITAVEQSRLWELDRETFNHIVKQAAVNQREHFEMALGKIEVLKGMDSYDRLSLADGIKTASFKAGEMVIRQGDWGDVFYMVEEGEAVALKTVEGAEVNVFEYKAGDFFGELALIKGQPRAASVKAVTELICLTLDRQSFDRLLGPLREEISSKASEYK